MPSALIRIFALVKKHESIPGVLVIIEMAQLVKALRKHENLSDKEYVLLSPSVVFVRETRDHRCAVVVHVGVTLPLDLDGFEDQVADALTNWGHEGSW